MLKKNILKNKIQKPLNQEEKIRKKKLMDICQEGFNFPNNFKPNTTIIQIHELYFLKTNEYLKTKNIKISIAGRMTQKRIMGKSSFFTLQDSDGKIQIYVTKNICPLNFYSDQFKKWNLGDIIGVTGHVFKTKTGELTIYSHTLTLLTKTLRPLPNKFHGLSDPEIKYRKRYLDLISNEESLKIFKKRSIILNIIRTFMLNNNFLEVETPMMHSIPGGATARPFITHHNALKINLYLRIAPELYLKQLIIGGFNKIFEINRNFRNEGLSTKHNPEFTMMETYITYADYKDMMQFTENLFKHISKKINNSTKVYYGEYTFDFSKKFKRLTMKQAILLFNKNIAPLDLKNIEILKNITLKLKIKVNKNWKLGHYIAQIFEKTVEKKLIEPTFITDYPIEISPLAKRNSIDNTIADRFELFIGGNEIGNGFSELNDAEDQKNRFNEQILNKLSENEQHILYDKDYITALEYGLPPTAGLGIGLDRLIMIFTNQHSIKDVILFPTLRPL
ncbi:lysine--tRNA ligase [Buchnera aphidicola (Pemphigus obesinymphae)]|uniref:lysine--tRNA ligase n=1 Tax=Buchnera aphidicola TaxID=9 RepID=UPI0022383CB9|nr:lysine--tRNA ligase [Buchnera aphidicola]MCW5196350.1 lysine--tRNA ligase [Buchnera aphidicola (Pemphigus obesinymphae)]